MQDLRIQKLSVGRKRGSWSHSVGEFRQLFIIIVVTLIIIMITIIIIIIITFIVIIILVEIILDIHYHCLVKSFLMSYWEGYSIYIWRAADHIIAVIYHLIIIRESYWAHQHTFSISQSFYELGYSILDYKKRLEKMVYICYVMLCYERFYRFTVLCYEKNSCFIMRGTHMFHHSRSSLRSHTYASNFFFLTYHF